MQNSLSNAALNVLNATIPDHKVDLSIGMSDAWRCKKLVLDRTGIPEHIEYPGRPEKPLLVPISQLPKRKLSTDEGHAALIHAITHIEFNAINLAWDAVYRFRDMPEDFYSDWVRVGEEEAHHFILLREHLRALGYDYGSFEAHNGLWEMAFKTAHDPLVRMALVPRVLEARGLDVTPGMIERLKERGDHDGVEILELILREEVGHVEIGSRWFHYLCDQRNLDSRKTFIELMEQYMNGQLKPPFHTEARLKAGFSKEELELLEKLS
ncbi:MAG: ferritin-like domain-containing protein [Gammaproteobacteria bacterium]|nr:ferritin-like domain-containing protein [Gammaproteobacteria bacterium]MDH5593224.1 ferritin-like domain-containing protein [Gammaproteobacteria bacterium]